MRGTTRGTAEAKVRTFRRGESWYFDLRLEGGRVRKPGGPTEAAARAAAITYLHAQDGDTLPAILEAWLEHNRVAGHRNRAIRTATNCAERLAAHFGDVPLGAIDLAALDKFKSKRVAGGAGPHTVNRDIRNLRAAWRWAHKRDRAPAPIAFEMLPTEEPRPQPLAPEQVAHLFEHAKSMDVGKKHGRIHGILVVAAFLGLRNSEIRNLQWRDVELDVARLTVRHTKSRQDRTLPLPATLVEILEEHRAATQPTNARAWVFTSPRGNQWADYTLPKAARKVWDAAGIGGDRDRVKPLHDLRATAACLQLATGGDLESVRENLGWKSREVVKHYLAAYDDGRRRAVDGVAAAVMGGRTPSGRD